ncbi:MAG: GNAT family N-acetyltransferase [Spirulina sp. SIO3F2]|nr:GNAT family N-acetyltransferase [Spirulina sp. SIO3F2]
MSTDAIEILISPPDKPGARQILAASDAYLAELYPPESNYASSPAELEAPEITFWIAQDAPTSMVLGCIALKMEAAGYGEIKRLFVQPSARGKGIGSKLMQTVIDAAQQQELHTLRLETGIYQTEAIALYQKFDFAPTEPFGDYEDDPYSVYYQKSLNDGFANPTLCPVCQRTQSEPSLTLCHYCAWPLTETLLLSTAQLVWVRQVWQQMQQGQALQEQLAQVQATILAGVANIASQFAATPEPEPADETISLPAPEPQMDYEPLWAQVSQALSQQQWQAADLRSAQLLVAIAQRERQGYLSPEDVAVLPPELLLRLDELWLEASEGHFGLSVQKQHHIALSGNRARITQVWPKLATELGWCQFGDQWLTYEELSFDLDAPQGHLPVLGDGLVWFVGGWSGAFEGFTKLMSRLP